MSVSIGDIFGVISLEDKFSPVIADVSSKLTEAGKKAKKLGQDLTEAGGQMTRGITAPLAAIGGGSVLAFSNFDSAMTGSLAIMDDMSTGMRDDMAQAARSMALELKPSAKDAADSYFFLASAGLDAAASIEALPIVGRFAQAGMFDMAKATDIATDAQSALGLTVDNIPQSMMNLTRVTDVLVKANTVANASVLEFGESLTTKAGSAMRELGIEVESGVAVLSVWADQGVKGAVAGERFNIVTRDLQTAFLNNRTEFEKMNIAVFDGSGNFRNMADIIEDMEGSLGSMSNEQKKAALTTLGFTDRSVQATSSLLGLSGKIREYETDLFNAGGMTQKVSDKQMKSFSAQLGLMKDRIVDVGISLGGSLAGVIREDVMPMVDGFVNILSGAVKWFTELPGPVKKGTIAIAAMAAAAGPLLVVAGGLIVSWGAFAAILPTLAVGFFSVASVLTGPVGWIAAGVALLLSWKPVRVFVVDMVGRVFKMFTGGVSKVLAALKLWWKSTQDGRTFLVEFSKVVLGDLVFGLKVLFAWGGSVVSSVYDTIDAFIEWSGIIDGVTAAGRTVITFVESLWAWLKKLGSRIIDWIGGLSGVVKVMEFLSPGVKSVIDQLKEWSDRARANIDANDDVGISVDDLSTKLDDAAVSIDTVKDSTTVLTDKMSGVDGLSVASKGVRDDLVLERDAVIALQLSHVEGTDSIKGYKLETEAVNAALDAGVPIAKAANLAVDGGKLSYDSLKGSVETLNVPLSATVELTEKSSGVFSDSSLAVDGNKLSYDFLKTTYLELNPEAESFVGLVKDSSDAFTAGVIPQGEYTDGFVGMAGAVGETSSKFTGMGDAFGAVVSDMIVNGGSLADSLDNIFGTTARDNLAEFVNVFASSFGASMDSSSTAAEAVSHAWGQSKDKIVNIANAIAAGMAAASGESEDLWIGAFTAIASFATGNVAGGFIALVGVIIGGIKQMSDRVRLSADEAEDFFGEMMANVQSGTDIAESWGQAMAHAMEVITIAFPEDGLRFIQENLSDMVDAAIDLGEQGVNAIEGVVRAADQAGLGSREIAQEMQRVFDLLSDHLEERTQMIIDQSMLMFDGISTLLTDSGQVTRGEVEFAAESAVQAFNAMFAAGMPMVDILAQIGDTFNLVGEQGALLGVELSDEFNRIGVVMDILSDTHLQNVISKLTSMGDIAEVSMNLGMLSAEQFTAFSDKLGNAFGQLVDGGLTGAEALAQIGPQLQLLLDMSQQYGFAVDENTQELLDMGLAQGVVTDSQLTFENIMIHAFDRMAEQLNLLIEALGGVPLALEVWTETIDYVGGETSGTLNDMSDKVDGVTVSVGGMDKAFIAAGTTITDTANGVGAIWHTTGDSIELRMHRMSGSMMEDINDVDGTWQTLMREMMRDMGGSIVAEAVENRTGKMAGNMAQSFGAMGASWTGVMSDMASGSDKFTSTSGSSFNDLTSELSGVNDELMAMSGTVIDTGVNAGPVSTSSVAVRLKGITPNNSEVSASVSTSASVDLDDILDANLQMLEEQRRTRQVLELYSQRLASIEARQRTAIR